MQVQIVFTGLCSFLNIHDVNDLMPEPSVILVTTNDMEGMDMGAEGAPADVAEDTKHHPFIAFDSSTTLVDDDHGFISVPQTLDQFRFLELADDLQGVLINIASAPAGKVVVHPSYDGDANGEGVVRRDDYWPEAQNQFNRDYVPVRGGLPKKSAVEAFLRFSGGTIWAGRHAKVEWRFRSPTGKKLSGKFPEEVVYAFQNEGEQVVIELSDLETGAPKRTLRFSLQAPATNDHKQPTMTLNIGNNMIRDMDNAVQRETPEVVTEAKHDHFHFLNKTAPVVKQPTVKLGPQPRQSPNNGGGGVGGGACGPNNGNS